MEKVVTKNENEMTEEQKDIVEEVQEDVNRAMNGTDEDREEIYEKYRNKAEEELEKRGYNYDELQKQAEDRANSLRQQYGY